MQDALATKASSPSAAASRAERAVRLAQALAGLPADYRDVIGMRKLPVNAARLAGDVKTAV